MNTVTAGQAKIGQLYAAGVTIGASGLVQVVPTITVGVEATNVINVSVVLKDGAGVTLTMAKALYWYLSSVSTGLTPLGTAPNGGTAAGTNGKIIESVAELSGLMIFTAAGLADINITDTGTPTMYLVIVTPGGGLNVSSAITFA
jgi:hypothetical protein